MNLAEKKAALEKMLEKHPINFRHLRTKQDGAITVAFIKDGYTITNAAFVFCAPSDTFCKIEGRFRAASRLLKNRGTMTTDLGFNIKDEAINVKILQAALSTLASKHTRMKVVEGATSRANSLPRWIPNFAKKYLAEETKLRTERLLKRMEESATNPF